MIIVVLNSVGIQACQSYQRLSELFSRGRWNGERIAALIGRLIC